MPVLRYYSSVSVDPVLIASMLKKLGARHTIGTLSKLNYWELVAVQSWASRELQYRVDKSAKWVHKPECIKHIQF
jgi:hypothetical protein